MPPDPPSDLDPCPDKPNCVSSLEEGKNFIKPISYYGSPESAMSRIQMVLSTTEGTTIKQATEDYVRVEYRSRIFGFIDDLELLLDKPNSQFHVRSASRIGYYDFNANCKRIEALREAFNNA